jgi:pimeloyl-ACP methyl ester carboxylesterase
MSEKTAQVVVDSLLTSYKVGGAGKTILLLHGWGDRAAGLKDLQAALSKKYKVIALDLPGFGNTQAPTSDWDLNDYANFVSNFLNKIGDKKLHAIIGHSNGGAIAVRGLANGDFKADKLVLMASAGIRGTANARNKTLQLLAKIGKVLTAPLPKSVKNRLRRQAYQTIGSDMLLAEHLQGTFKKVVADDVRADAAKLKLPTLLLYGGNDEATPAWYGQTYHELIRGSKLEVLPETGHFIHLEQSQKIAAEIEEFLK